MPKPTNKTTMCRYCGSENVEVQTRESFDGAFDDLQFYCLDCREVWWLDGIDS